jgi:hypothetical protein
LRRDAKSHIERLIVFLQGIPTGGHVDRHAVCGA